MRRKDGDDGDANLDDGDQPSSRKWIEGVCTVRERSLGESAANIARTVVRVNRFEPTRGIDRMGPSLDRRGVGLAFGHSQTILPDTVKD